MLQIAILLLALTAPAQSSPHQHPPAAAQTSASTSYDNLQWQTMVSRTGRRLSQVAMLRVDPKTQATQLLIRIPKQMHIPMHWHSANETHTVIKGTFVFEHEGRAARARTRRVQLPPRAHAPSGMGVGRCAGVHHG